MSGLTHPNLIRLVAAVGGTGRGKAVVLGHLTEVAQGGSLSVVLSPEYPVSGNKSDPLSADSGWP